MFTACAIVLNGAPQAPSAVFEAQRLLSVLPAIAIAARVLIYLGVLAGVHVMPILHRDLRQNSNDLLG